MNIFGIRSGLQFCIFQAQNLDCGLQSAFLEMTDFFLLILPKISDFK